MKKLLGIFILTFLVILPKSVLASDTVQLNFIDASDDNYSIENDPNYEETATSTCETACSDLGLNLKSIEIQNHNAVLCTCTDEVVSTTSLTDTSNIFSSDSGESRIQFPQIFPEEKGGLEDFRVYIRNFYVFAIGAALLIATVLIMIGGFIWVTSAGNQERVSKAQSYITQSVIGVVLLMSAYLILRLINPALVELRLPTFPEIGELGSCISPLGCNDNIPEDLCVSPNVFSPGKTCYDGYISLTGRAREIIQDINNLNRIINQCNSFSQSSEESECQALCNAIDPACTENFSGGICQCNASSSLLNELELLKQQKAILDELSQQGLCENFGEGFIEPAKSGSDDAQCRQVCSSRQCSFVRSERVTEDLSIVERITHFVTPDFIEDALGSGLVRCFCKKKNLSTSEIIDVLENTSNDDTYLLIFPLDDINPSFTVTPPYDQTCITWCTTQDKSNCSDMGFTYLSHDITTTSAGEERLRCFYTR